MQGRLVVATKNVKVLFGISCARLNYQPLFGKMSPHSSPRRSGWTRAISFVGFSQSCYRLQIFVWQGLSHKLSDQNKVVKMADNADKMNLAFERVLECFKLQKLKDSQREALQNIVKGQDVFVIQPTGSGKSLIFQSAPIVFDTVRPLTNAKSIALVISPLASLMQGRVYKGRTGKRRGQATRGTRGMPNRVWLTRGIFFLPKDGGECSATIPTKRGCVWLQLMKLTAFLTGKSIYPFAFSSVL